MDIERIKKISESKIKAGVLTNQVRNAIKEYQHERQDMQEDLSETFKPIVKAQEEVKQTIDEKQDKMLEQLQKNQKALTSGFEDLLMLQHLPDAKPQEATKLPFDYKPTMMEPQYKSDLDTGFSKDEIQKLMEYNLYAPSDVLKASMKGELDINEYDNNIGKQLMNLGQKKGGFSNSSGKKMNKKNQDIRKRHRVIEKIQE